MICTALTAGLPLMAMEMVIAKRPRRVGARVSGEGVGCS